jgi:hypothetical protein
MRAYRSGWRSGICTRTSASPGVVRESGGARHATAHRSSGRRAGSRRRRRATPSEGSSGRRSSTGWCTSTSQRMARPPGGTDPLDGCSQQLGAEGTEVSLQGDGKLDFAPHRRAQDSGRDRNAEIDQPVRTPVVVPLVYIADSVVTVVSSHRIHVSPRRTTELPAKLARAGQDQIRPAATIRGRRCSS